MSTNDPAQPPEESGAGLRLVVRIFLGLLLVAAAGAFYFDYQGRAQSDQLYEHLKTLDEEAKFLVKHEGEGDTATEWVGEDRIRYPEGAAKGVDPSTAAGKAVQVERGSEWKPATVVEAKGGKYRGQLISQEMIHTEVREKAGRSPDGPPATYSDRPDALVETYTWQGGLPWKSYVVRVYYTKGEKKEGETEAKLRYSTVTQNDDISTPDPQRQVFPPAVVPEGTPMLLPPGPPPPRNGPAPMGDEKATPERPAPENPTPPAEPAPKPPGESEAKPPSEGK